MSPIAHDFNPMVKDRFCPDGRLDTGRAFRAINRVFLILCLLIIGSVQELPFSIAQSIPHHRLTEQEKRGRLIYLKGTTSSGREVVALLGEDQIEVPASTLPCASCHGFDGLGRAEGGVEPPNLTWESLTKSYGHEHTNGRKHPAFTDQSLKKAIISGIDSGGNKLQVTMPVYRMSSEDMSDLVAYLKLLGKYSDPGLTDTTIRIGTILPAAPGQAEIGRITTALLSAYFEEISSRGGIYNRKLELRGYPSSESAAAALAQAGKLIQEDQVFALVGGYIAGEEKEVVALAETEEVPIVGPITLFPRAGSPLNRQVFYLFAGLREQAQTFMRFASEKLEMENDAIAVVFPESSLIAEQALAVLTQSEKTGLKNVRKLSYSSKPFDAVALARRLRGDKTAAIVFFGGGEEAIDLMTALSNSGLVPYFFIPGSFAGDEIFNAPRAYKGKIYLSYPTTPANLTRAGMAEFWGLIEKYGLSTKHMPIQLSVLNSAHVLVEGLKLAGRELSRERLITALEGLYEFETGLGPNFTFGPNRRIGALGAYVIGVDLEKKQFIPSNEWVSGN